MYSRGGALPSPVFDTSGVQKRISGTPEVPTVLVIGVDENLVLHAVHFTPFVFIFGRCIIHPASCLVSDITISYFRLTTFVFFSLLFYLVCLQSHHNLSSLPRDDHILSLPIILYTHRDFNSVFNLYFRNCSVPLTTNLNYRSFYHYSCRLHNYVRQPGLLTCLGHSTYRVMFIRAPMGRLGKCTLWPFPHWGGAASAVP